MSFDGNDQSKTLTIKNVPVWEWGRAGRAARQFLEDYPEDQPLHSVLFERRITDDVGLVVKRTKSGVTVKGVL